VCDLRHAEPRALGRLKQEILNLRDLRHPHVARLHNVVVEGDDLVLVLELVDGGDLLDVLNAQPGGRLPEDLAGVFFSQLLSGIRGCHAVNLAHRDIKPENVMVCASTGVLKLIDLGLSKHLNSARTLGTGTPDYMAPELICGGGGRGGWVPGGEEARRVPGGYDAALADVWSMGCTLYLMVAGTYPFEDPARPRDLTALLRNVQAGRYKPLPETVSVPLRDLLSRMLDPAPSSRITMADLAVHPWVLHAAACGGTGVAAPGPLGSRGPL
jgi:serine/threonine protein kinase